MSTMYRRQQLLADRAPFADTEPAPTYPACVGGPCDQGRRLCPCPDACNRMADDLGPATGILVALAIVGGIVTLVLALHYWLT